MPTNCESCKLNNYTIIVFMRPAEETVFQQRNFIRLPHFYIFLWRHAMAERLPDDVHDLLDEFCGLSVDCDDRPKPVQLDDALSSKLDRIRIDYESVFSWHVKELTGDRQNLMCNMVDKCREKYEITVDNDDAFNLNRFYLQLIICYELYINESYKESLLEIESVIKTLESCKFDESNEQYSDACNHVARATNAFILSTLNLDFDKILKDIKPVKNLNQAEKAAICAIKARLFMEYPPKGNDLALDFATQARNLYSTEPEWIIIWLKAKGRVRRYYAQFEIPDEYEIDAAETLSSTKTKPRPLIQASKLFMELAFVHKINLNLKESRKYYKLSLVLICKAVELSKNNIKQLCSCFLNCINYPKEFLPLKEVNQLILKLKDVNNSRVDDVLGKYYLKYERDYVKAKLHLSRAMAAGHFSSALKLIKVECLIQSVNSYPIIKSLNLIYDVFPSPKRRLIILSQIIIYYFYENNPKEMMHYLKLYMDQDIDNTLKKHHLVHAYPLFKLNQSFKPKQFLNILSFKLKSIESSYKWKEEDKKTINNTLIQFDNMMKVKMYNDKVSNSMICVQKQGFKNKSTRTYSNKKQNHKINSFSNWQQQ